MFYDELSYGANLNPGKANTPNEFGASAVNVVDLLDGQRLHDHEEGVVFVPAFLDLASNLVDHVELGSLRVHLGLLVDVVLEARGKV